MQGRFRSTAALLVLEGGKGVPLDPARGRALVSARSAGHAGAQANHATLAATLAPDERAETQRRDEMRRGR